MGLGWVAQGGRHGISVWWTSSCARRVYIVVYAAATENALLNGIVCGRWTLGAAGGNRLGSVLWLDTGHVVRLIGQGLQDLHDVVPAAAAACAPWWRSCAGGRKAKSTSNRGAHLQAGNDEVLENSKNEQCKYFPQQTFRRFTTIIFFQNMSHVVS